MQILMSRKPSPSLRPYVCAFAQRRFERRDPPLVESVPAQLEQVLNFELGEKPRIVHRIHRVSDVVWVGGAQTSFPGYMELRPGVESFAIFFQPAGWSALFGIPIHEITNRIVDATVIAGFDLRVLWNQLGEESCFDSRVRIAEKFLLARANYARAYTETAEAAIDLYRHHGAPRIRMLANFYSLGLRQFERRFDREIGASPKIFARVARFQGALDAKLAAPRRTWLDIAHSFGYFDQMHMIHDFEKLGSTTPTRLIAQIGDVRPPALVGKQE